jgi:hypothetical protein
MQTSTSTLAVDPGQYMGQKRHANRQQLVAAATLFAETGPVSSQGLRVHVFDLSLSGVGFHSERPARVGSIYRVKLDTEAMHLASRIRIARCTPQDGGYDIGASFVEG